MRALLFTLVSGVLWLAWKLTRRQSALQTGHEHTPKMAADPVSSLFPNRPIRPLPKRRLRERLSPEVADSIQYPPLPQTMAPLFPYPYPLVDENAESSFTLARAGGSYTGQRQPQSNGSGLDSDEDSAVLKGGAANRAPTEPSARIPRAKPEHGRYGDTLPILLASSSPDGYDPFENTNNKKRKIPTAGDSAPSGVHAISDSVAGTSHFVTTVQSTEAHGETSASTSTPYYGSGSFASGAHNVPGPGRGRFGRPKSGKTPTRPLFDSTNSWAGRSNKPRPGQWPSGSSKSISSVKSAQLSEGSLRLTSLCCPSSNMVARRIHGYHFECYCQC